ncbi:phosphoglycerate mutase [Actinoplanes sp. OR16]|uniref:histidine phosphatase family protein n=1 Tax=Actinoplanes sp. OR16 TaxID=946334 RepID=UPI000F6E23E5|nr:histidine phosphatase family protein [Actinoplanes sp. OR16]BBH69777.1 phosphoglycerate mutase [Actinoplanes sp. OR16]
MLLIRHGQASFGADDYDALSPTGHEQARTLGRSLKERGIRPAIVVRGTMRRHEETAAGLEIGAETIVDGGWDEFDFQHVVEVHRPSFRDRAAMMAELNTHDRPDRAFQEIFEAATGRWCSGESDRDYVESFSAFRDRVTGALDRASGHKDVVVVTSGGPIAMAAALLTCGAPGITEAWTALNRVVVNTGVTKLIGGRRGLSMSTYNEHTHLEADPRLLTYR